MRSPRPPGGPSCPGDPVTPVRFGHVADLHLDTPFKGLGQVDPWLAEQLREASLSAWDNVVRECLERALDFLVIAGDVYDGEQAGTRAQIRFLHGVRRLADAGVEVFVVHGNHDPRGGRWPAVREWPAGVHVFGHEDVEARVVERHGRAVAVVAGMSFPTQHVTENLARRYRRTPADVFHIGLLHCNVGSDPAHDPYAPCSLDDLAEAGMDYWALGHIHARRVLREARPAVVYPGNPQGRHAHEGGARGFYVVDASAGGGASLEFVATDLWRFAAVSLDLADRRLRSVAELADALAAAALRELAHSDGRGLLLRAAVGGRGPLHADLARPGVLAQLTRQLRDEAREDGLRLWWDEISDETRAPLDRAVLAAREDFVGDLLRQSDAWAAEPGAVVRPVLERLAAFRGLGLLLRDGGIEGLLADAPAIVSEAEALALDRLEVGGAA